MSYAKEHNNDECDRCLNNVGKNNLFKTPFFYMDKNDDTHEDMSPYLRIRTGKQYDDGYRQYYVCQKCYESQMKMRKY